ncbi:MAG TPA: hypothetical protein VK470_07390 [Bacteroidota bacterium]|nr:hypothetical protein [Bacteroidota bacterium]
MFSAYALAAYADDSVMLLGKASFTTNTRIFYNVDNPQIIADMANVSSNFGFGAEVRVRTFWERWYIGLAVEQIKGSQQTLLTYSGPYNDVLVPRTDGYEIMPIELSGYYSVPISSNTIVFYLGGGIGYYKGKRNYSIGNADSRSDGVNSALGIQVSTGLRWMITPMLGIEGQLRFRDPQISATNVFDQSATTYGGVRVLLSRTPSHTTINLNGINYSAGLAIVF